MPKAKTKAKPKTTKKAEPSAEQAFEEALRRASDELVDAALRRREIEGQLKEARGDEQAAVKAVERLRKQGPENHPLFDGPADKAPPQQQQPDWQALPLTETGLSDKQVAKLDKLGQKTLGDLAKLTEQKGPNWHTAFQGKGVGPAFSAAVNAHMERFWQAHPELVPAEEPGVIVLTEDLEGIGQQGDQCVVLRWDNGWPIVQGSQGDTLLAPTHWK